MALVLKKKFFGNIPVFWQSNRCDLFSIYYFVPFHRCERILRQLSRTSTKQILFSESTCTLLTTKYTNGVGEIRFYCVLPRTASPAFRVRIFNEYFSYQDSFFRTRSTFCCDHQIHDHITYFESGPCAASNCQTCSSSDELNCSSRMLEIITITLVVEAAT